MGKKSFQTKIKQLVDSDQKELTDLSKKLKSVNSIQGKMLLIKRAAMSCQIRAEEMKELVSSPGVDLTISGIGEETTNGVILLTLHSYLEIMEYVYDLYSEFMQVKPTDLPLDYLAVLRDRIHIIKFKKQVMGTIDYMIDGKRYFVPVEDISNLNSRRSEFNMQYLVIDDVAKAQKPMSKEEYDMNFAYMDKKITG